MRHPFLSFLEVALLRWLARSPRIGLILVKQYGTNISWVINDRSDPRPMPTNRIDESSFMEPPSLALERMFHAPDAEK